MGGFRAFRRLCSSTRWACFALTGPHRLRYLAGDGTDLAGRVVAKTTARDIAQACGTSLSAVSRAFRSDGAIAPELRRVILAEAALQGYAPPPQRGRARRNAVSIGLIIGDIENPFYPLVLKRMSSAAAAKGWQMITFIAPDRGTIDLLMAQVLAADLDVVALASAELSSVLAAECRDRALPVVCFNRIQADADMAAVCTDNYGGGVLAGQRLISTGCRALAFVGGRKETSTHLERRRGFMDTLNAAGLALRHEALGLYEYEASLHIGRALFAKPKPPDGVFCANDNMGFAVIDAAHEAGLLPGRDVSIIGYDDVPMASWNRYQLTTISQQVDEMVRRTILAIQRVAAKPGADGFIDIVPAKMILRQSG